MRLIIAGMKDFLTSTPPLQLALLAITAVLLVLTVGRLLVLAFKPTGETFPEGSMYAIKADPAVWDDFKALLTETGLLAPELFEEAIRAYRAERARIEVESGLPSNLVAHARRELELIGEEPDVIEGYLKVIQAFADMGHSGGSAMVAIPTIGRLFRFENLAPLTDNAEDWIEVGYGIWQNRRCSRMFSEDGGKSYTDVEDREKVVHVSASGDRETSS